MPRKPYPRLGKLSARKPLPAPGRDIRPIKARPVRPGGELAPRDRKTLDSIILVLLGLS